MKVHPPDDYLASRKRFRSYLSRIQDRWEHADLDSANHPAEDDLSMEWIRADAVDEKKQLFLLTTGEHGIEGYVGAVMLDLFVNEFLSGLNPRNTGMLVVHPINPWGMKHQRRTNYLNVDLNRNFLQDEKKFRTLNNPGYQKLERFLNPRHALGAYWRERVGFLFRFLRTWIELDRDALQGATLLGQYQFPRGIYFGGREYQFETEIMFDLFHNVLQQYEQVVHIDIHTGYGPGDQMTLVNSPFETQSPSLLAERFGYPRVVSADPQEFYSIEGDMIDRFYRIARDEYPERSYFGTAFEFGTVGEGLLTSIRSLRTMIFENQIYWHGVEKEKTAEKVHRDYVNLYYPQQSSWYKKAFQDAHQAFRGILTEYRLLDDN